jgi:hypothetical protein
MNYSENGVWGLSDGIYKDPQWVHVCLCAYEFMRMKS